jgi:hypothetical protein
MIRTSKHTTDFTTNKKLAIYHEFLTDYTNAVIFYINHVWNNKIEYKGHVFDIKNNKWDCPTQLSTTDIEYKTDLSARALKCAMTQALGIIRAVTAKHHKRMHVLKKKQKENTKEIKYNL